MRILIIVCLVLISLNTNANYPKFISCEFQDHAFVQSLAQYVHTQAANNKVVIFDDTPVGFSGRQVSNKGFYLDYDVIDCTLNLTTMTSSCAIVPTSIELKYGVKPSQLTPVYLSTIKQSLDGTKLDSFLDKVVNHLVTDLSLIVPSLGTIGTDTNANVKFSNGTYPFVSSPAPSVYSPCPNTNVSWIGSTANQVTIDSFEVYGSEVTLHFYLQNGVIDAFASDYVCSYYYDPDYGGEVEDCNSDFSSHLTITESDRGKQFTIESDFVYVQFRITGITSTFSYPFY